MMSRVLTKDPITKLVISLRAATLLKGSREVLTIILSIIVNIDHTFHLLSIIIVYISNELSSIY